jgi:saccharopine dehydrogenase (NAD+, L-lysine-forming)
MQKTNSFIIGIQSEEKNVWERRTPLTPEDSRKLICEYNIKIIVQPSSLRCFTDEDYFKSGCYIQKIYHRVI